MNFSIHDFLVKTTLGIQYIKDQHSMPSLRLESQLRRLLIMVNGTLTVEQLLAQGLANVDIDSFQTLIDLGLLELPHLSDDVEEDQSERRIISFSTARFTVLDQILESGMTDAKVMGWVERFERTKNLEELTHQVFAFIASPQGIKTMEIHDVLLQAIGRDTID